MADKELPQSSDDSDADYVPEGVAENLSEEESGNDSCKSGSDDESLKKSRPKKKRGKVTNEKEIVGEKSETSTEKTSVEIDKLWADFKEDVDKLHSNVHHSKEKNNSNNCSSSVLSPPGKEEPPKKVPRLAPGVGSTVSKPKAGLSSIIGQLGKKNKLSTLEKSKQDWMKFKKSEGIEEDIQIHNRGKGGYLEKQDFLQRSDVRQFEIEKELRTTKRSNR